MSKATIELRARNSALPGGKHPAAKQPRHTTHGSGDADQSATRLDGRDITLLADAIAAAIVRELQPAALMRELRQLREALPTIARLAAADTIHTMEGREAVLRRAIQEGREARAIIAEAEEKKQ